jgi:hypothetical protein
MELAETVEIVTSGLDSVEKLGQPLCHPTPAEEITPELTKKRELSSFMKECLGALGINAPMNFEESIRLSIELNFEPQKNMLGQDIGETYGLDFSSDTGNETGFEWKTQVGLFSHPMCEIVDSYFISRNSNDKSSRIKNAIPSMNKLIQKYNALFYQYQKEKLANSSTQVLEVIQKKMKNFYFSLLASMALKESLGDADNSKQSQLAKKFSEDYSIINYKRPPGVKFYFDKEQKDEVSKQNIGLYQFSPNSTGNINACYKAWNNIMGKKSKSCLISDLNNKRSFEYIAASDQVFNAFCGTNKLIQSYGVQVNSQTFKHPKVSVMQLTHSENSEGKKLKEPSQRCISPFAHKNNAYMHFGVLGFTVYSEGLDGKPSSNTQQVIDTALQSLE